MGTIKIKPKKPAPKEQAADICEMAGTVNLDHWITIDEAVDLREKIKKPLSKQQLYTLAAKFAADDNAFRIKGVICFLKSAIEEYEGQRGRPWPAKAEAKAA